MRIFRCLLPLLLVSCSQTPVSSSLRGLDAETEAGLLGTYAQRLTFSNISEFPIAGKNRTVARYDLIVELVKESDAYYLIGHSCRLAIESDGLLKVTVADKSMQALAPTKTLVTFEETDQGLVLHSPTQVQTIGVNLRNPQDELPTKANDPQIYDADHDSKPGFTASASALGLTSELYMIQRSTSSYDLPQTAPGVFQGLLHDRTDQVVVGTSNLLASAAKGKLNLTPDPDPSQSTVQLVKAQGLKDCSALTSLLIK